MKKAAAIYFVLFFCLGMNAQENEKISSTQEQQLENMAEANDAGPKDDSYLQQLDHFKKHPLNINAAGADELDELNVLSGLQIQAFLAYRKLFGILVNQYELQAIPSWDIATIKKLLPFIEVTDNKNLADKLKERWSGGDAKFLARYGRVLEKSKGYNKPADSSSNYYLGSRDKFYLRYSYNYKNLLQWGILADKDAGEQFFKGGQRQGFDFYSFHFFARKLGIIKALAIGDFTVNFGQGLIQWQSLAFKKNADAMAIKRQASTIRPYNSAGEYNFHRGIGITLQKRKWETTLFASYRKISANINPDSVLDDGIVSSFLTSGYHRTASENADKNSLAQTAFGGNLKYQGNNWNAGINVIHYHFSAPIQKTAEPYNLFALNGSSLTNASIDYGYTWRNVHLFGEAAIDNKLSKAFLNAAVISVAAKADVSVVYRKIDRSYRSVNANAFTENTYPINENGMYVGISLRPINTLRVDAYADIFQFPWLKYRVDAPSSGKDFLVQLTYTPNKQVELYARYKSETKMINRSADTLTTAILDLTPKQNFRFQASININRQLTFRNRLEVLWYNANAPGAAGQGFLEYIETLYKPARAKWAGNLRLQYFETSGYDERIYTYETDLPYNFSIPFYYGKGLRYYFNFNWKATTFVKRKKRNTSLDIGFRWAQTVYTNRTVIGSGLDQINGNHQSEIKLQLILIP